MRMKNAVRVALAVATVLVLWLVPLIWAGSSGEIVTLTTTDAKGAARQTRLWIVERGGASWLRAGSERAAWLARIRANPRIQIERRWPCVSTLTRHSDWPAPTSDRHLTFPLHIFRKVVSNLSWFSCTESPLGRTRGSVRLRRQDPPVGSRGDVSTDYKIP
jgi:hypothetical protein